jgi:Ca2+-binding EF-hand superfamily protein
MNPRKSVRVACAVVVLIAAGTVLAQKVDKSVNEKERRILLGQDEVKELLLLMDTDKSGKISRQEFMNFMAAEFDRLDTDKSGELDPKELTRSQVRASRPAVGK